MNHEFANNGRWVSIMCVVTRIEGVISRSLGSKLYTSLHASVLSIQCIYGMIVDRLMNVLSVPPSDA